VSGRLRILLGLDCDRPRSEFRSAANYESELQAVVDYLPALTSGWERTGVSWTVFACGQFVEALREVMSFDEVRSAFHGSAGRGEVACHTYSHRAIASVPGRPELEPLTEDGLRRDLEANTTALTGLATDEMGFRGPYGYCAGGVSDGILDVIAESRTYASLMLRDPISGICPPLRDRQGRLRRPFRYANGLWEVPSHGWHDTYLAGMSPTITGPIATVPVATAHYRDLIVEARETSRSLGEDVYVGLALHPIAMLRYDPEFELLPGLLSVADPSECVGYGEAIEVLRADLDDEAA
jgi:peptidoglycan/xylan/chitin deacetylase (PgdA/CDA1 family)